MVNPLMHALWEARIFGPDVPVNARRFEDPLACRTEWKTIRRGQVSGYSIRRLCRGSGGRLRFRPAGAIMVPVLGFTLAAAPEIPLLVLFLTLLGEGLVYFFPFGFDREHNRFVKGYRQCLAGGLPLTEIHALQFLCRHNLLVEQERSPRIYDTFELNLVLEDGSRRLVAVRGDGRALRLDGLEIAGYLGVPLWDAAGLC